MPLVRAMALNSSPISWGWISFCTAAAARMRFRANPHGTDFVRIDLRAQHSVALGLDRHGDHILVQAGDSFFLDGQPAGTVGPNT